MNMDLLLTKALAQATEEDGAAPVFLGWVPSDNIPDAYDRRYRRGDRETTLVLFGYQGRWKWN